MSGNIILGAGVAGLAYAYASDEPFELYEKNDYAGGLCHSFYVGDFCFDSAVHLSFTQTPEAREVFDQAEQHYHHPVMSNFYHGQWLKHPVANNLSALPVEERVELVADYIGRDTTEEMRNYSDYLRLTFGPKLAEKFPEVYTRKYWVCEAKDLSTTWVGQRLCPPDIKKVLKGAMTAETGNDYYADEMRHPVRGGTKAS